MTKEIRYILLVSFMLIACLVINIGCAKGVNSKKAIANEAIYPLGALESAKIFDEQHEEKIVYLKQTDIEYMVNLVKASGKEVVTDYDSSLELNISFSDSKVQLINAEDEIVYYVFHNGEINGICYKIHSEELSEWVLNLMEESN